jgi:diguanylate cyclase (GGDEF)-like protein
VIRDSFRLVALGVGAVVLLTTALLVWILTVSRPAIARYQDGLISLQTAHSAMLDQETGIRGYLITGDPRYLEPYEQGRRTMAGAEEDLRALADDSGMTDAIIDVVVAQRLWTDAWAEPASNAAAGPDARSARLDAGLERGKRLFDAYRLTETRATESASDTLAYLWRRQTVATSGLIGASVVLGGLLLVGVMNRRRILQRDVLEPVEVVLTGMDAVRRGDLGRSLTAHGPAELVRVIEGFNAMASSLAETSAVAEGRAAHIHAQAEKLRAILRMVREIGGSLNLSYVLQSVVEGVQFVTGAERVGVWLLDEAQATLSPAGGAAAGTGAPPPSGEPVEVGTGVIGRAAKYGRSTHGTPVEGETTAHVAVPMIIGARVVGVMEMWLPDGGAMSDEQVEVLETLSVHAAAAIEAARLHEGAAHASEHDALTRLANRRRLEDDLRLECDRSLRYAQPVALILIDLDHFKTINDTFGHGRGDEILQGVAETLTNGLRSTDTAYRYGGEELVVLARDSDSRSAGILAERLRAAIEHRFADHGEGQVTASMGVASVPDHAATPKALLAAADAALYSAKQAGRNRVILAGTAPSPLVSPGI